MGQRQAKYADLIAQRVIDEIVEHDLPPGAMLPAEKDMLERYGVGRGTLREALRHLELQGVLTMRPGPGGGPMVASPGAEHLASSVTLLLTLSRTPFREVVDVAVALAPTLAQLAAEQADADDIAALRAGLAELTLRLKARDGEGFMRAHQRFQALLATATGNGLLGMLHGALQNIISGSDTGVTYSHPQMRATLTTHRATVDAVEDHDGERARAVVDEHMEAWRRMLARQHPDALDRPVRWSGA
jgi:DNA-binding FadR family transcriptional regulator